MATAPQWYVDDDGPMAIALTMDDGPDEKYTPQVLEIFRAPYGNWSKAVFEACAARSLRPVGWSVDPRDWDVEHVSTQMIVDNVMRNTRAHDIILEHDGGGDRSHTVAALKIFIPELLARGFNFVAM